MTIASNAKPGAVLLAAALGLACAEPLRAGEAVPLIHCSDTADWGAARWGRAQLLKSLGEKDALLLCTGGSLSVCGLPAEGKSDFPVRMLEAAGFDVVNLAHRDLTGRGGAGALLAAMRSAKGTQFVSANISMKGAPWKPFGIVSRGGQRVAVIGVAAPSRSLTLPGADVIPGLTVGDPQKAIAAALKDAAGKADRVILLADRAGQSIIEMRASRTGTIVERTWPGETVRRLSWAADNGNLDAPGLPPATGKNLYHRSERDDLTGLCRSH